MSSGWGRHSAVAIALPLIEVGEVPELPLGGAVAGGDGGLTCRALLACRNGRSPPRERSGGGLVDMNRRGCKAVHRECLPIPVDLRQRWGAREGEARRRGYERYQGPT